MVSTDVLVQDRHFRLDWSTPHDVGRKAIAQNAADIEAMGARATAFVVGFGAPGDTPAAHADALVDGMWDEAGRIGAGIVGGDLVSCPQWVLSVTVLGDLDGRAPVLRFGSEGRFGACRRRRAWPLGGRICACGTTRLRVSTSCGAAIWCREPPYGEGAAAAAAGAQAMIDVSDGLVADLRHVAEASGVGIDLSTAALAADHGALIAAAAAVGAPTRGRGCWAAAKTTPWWRVSPVRCRPAGASSAECSTGRPG